MLALLARVLSFFGGPLGKVVGYAAAAVGVMLLCLFLVRQHDDGIRAADAAAAQHAADAFRIKSANIVIADLQAANLERAARQKELGAATVEILNATPPPVACTAPAALVAAFKLLPDAGAGSHPAANPRVAPVVPAGRATP